MSIKVIKILAVVPLLLFLTTNVSFVKCSSAMKRLYEDLFSDYNRLILPVAKNQTKVTVTVGLKLGQILDLNLKQQILSTNVWVEQTWHDYKLEWDPNQYEGIDMVHVPAENIWIPDIVLFNNADGNYELTLVAKARVFFNGTVVWHPPTMFRSTCEIDVEFFPFDVQTCYLRFGSWTYAGDEVELKLIGNKSKVTHGIDLSQFYKNVEWDIIEVPAYQNDIRYDCCSETYPDIVFKIVIRRKILFYLVNLILPVALMTFLTVSVFYLPSDSNEKVTLSISILTSLIVFFLLMLEIIPASSLAVPLFGKYLLFTLVLVSLSACVSVYVLNLHHRSPNIHSMSPRTRHIFLKILPKLLFLNQPNPRERSSLNRFRQKKIAQQMLKKATSPTNKVYDLAQSMAASLNLIETLHKSYHFNPDDDRINQDGDDEGRYFRHYVDDYITLLKKQELDQKHAKVGKGDRNKAKTAKCSETSRCCWRATQPLRRNQDLDMNWSMIPDHSENFTHNCNRRLEHQKSMLGSQRGKNSFDRTCNRGIIHDDTLDMTFDCEDQENSILFQNKMASGSRCNSMNSRRNLLIDHDHVPTPPPPPKELAQLTSTMSIQVPNYRSSTHIDDRSHCLMANNEPMGERLDKLINNIHSIYDHSDEMDTTNGSNEVGDYMRTEYTDHSTRLVSSPRFGLTSQMSSFRRENSGAQPNHLGQSTCEPSDIYHRNKNSSIRSRTCSCKVPQKHSIQDTIGNDGRANTNEDDLNKKLPSGLDTSSQPSELLLALRLPYDKMPPHVRAAIRSILFIADTIKNEDDENSAIEDWESMSMVVDRLFFCIFFVLCTVGSFIILASAPSLFDERAPIDEGLSTDIAPSNCSDLKLVS